VAVLPEVLGKPDGVFGHAAKKNLMICLINYCLKINDLT